MGGSNRSKDGQKTKKELIAELEELRRKVSEEKAGDRGRESGEPTLTADISRREALKIAWVAPVILSVPLASVGTARRAQAGTVPPTMMPTSEPTSSPTSSPTTSPTASDATLQPPTVAPTTAMEPTLAPTAFPSVRAVPAVSTGAAAAAAAALFGFGVKKLHDKISSEPEAEPSSAPDDDSGNGDESS